MIPSSTINGTAVLFRTLVLCVLMAAVLIIPFTIDQKGVSQVLFVCGLAIAIPTFIAIHRGWNRWFWWRRLQAARKGALLAPSDVDKQVELGLIATVTGDSKLARAAYERACELSPGQPDAMVGLGHLLAEEGDLDGALARFSAVAAAHPDHFAAHYGVGGVHQRQEQHARAVAAFEKALALEPDDRFTLHELARSHLALGNVEKAVEYRSRSADQGVKDADLDRQIRALQAG